MIKFYISSFGLFLLVLEMWAKDDGFDFSQNDYIMDSERMELARFNKKDVSHFEVHTFKYNRTCPLVNMTVTYNVELGNEMQIVVQAHRFASNEYRFFPIRLEVNYCDAIKKNMIGCGRFLNCGNFTGCPMVKGFRYHYCNWSPDQTQFPPYIPSGQYMLELQGLYHATELWILHAFGTVSRPITSK